jgi:hypothetical protein
MRFYQDFPQPYFSKEPRLGTSIVYEHGTPLPGRRVVGYMIYDRPASCLVPPFRRELNAAGCLGSAMLLVVFWPVFWLPFCTGCSYDGFQVPVFE